MMDTLHVHKQIIQQFGPDNILSDVCEMCTIATNGTLDHFVKSKHHILTQISTIVPFYGHYSSELYQCSHT